MHCSSLSARPIRHGNIRALLLVGALLAPAWCVAQRKGNYEAEYDEDLSGARKSLAISTLTKSPSAIETPAPIRHSGAAGKATLVNAKVNATLDSIARLGFERGYIDGYAIQVHVGKNRQEAMAAKSKVMSGITSETLKTSDISLRYEQPNFLVAAGRYFSPLAAQSDLLRIRVYFPKAILIPEKISIHQAEQ